ncbi:MAG: hypothetical protein OXG74_01020 [Acidobacteria bacterium]|nr:hypothetical protein [Acidobacteriota bacterium]
MSEDPYKVRGVEAPEMLGRQRLFDGLCRHLVKATPDHVCVVGPPQFGKSVLLNHLALQFKTPGEHYVTSLYLDLRHATPGTDDEFRLRFAEGIKDSLQVVRPECAEYLELEGEGLHDLLLLVFDELAKKRLRLLAVLDGFDHVLAGSGITRNLWDEMRTLAQKSSLRLVTGSRGRLRELCKTEESRTSDFWEIFYDTPLQVGCFEDDDWDSFLRPFKVTGVSLDKSAVKELSNWSGGVPVLAVAMAERLLAAASQGQTLSKPDVDATAEATIEERRELLAALWDDCSIELQSDLAAIAASGLPLREIADERRRDLERRGFARAIGKKIRPSCRLMAQYALQRAEGVANLRRMFGAPERFEGNIRNLLELRLTQVDGADPELRDFVERAIRDLQPEPVNSVVWARSIAGRALDLIWEAELPNDRSMPDDWKFAGVQFDDRGRLPRSRGRQCQILRRITGTEHNDPAAMFVTKPTCLLVDHLQSIGDFGQHREEATVSIFMATAFCLSSIGLCESLARDLAASKRSRS